jgi:hypothetical protein
MQAAARPYVLASAALLATSMVAPTLLVARQLQPPVRSIDTRLVDVDITGVDAIPFNLFQDIVNIPANEIDAFNLFGVSLIDGGTWLTSDATNLWGEDPGDPSRFIAGLDTVIPFTAISGQGSPEPGYGDFNWADAADGHLGLGQQLSLLLDAELPASSSSDATWSGPLDPVAPITGLTGIDRLIWEGAVFTDQTPFPLTNDWFQVPLSELTSGTFNFGTVVDPSAGVGPDGSVPTDDVFGFAGTNPLYNIPGDPASGVALNANDNPINLMPWSNESFTLNLAYPFENFFNSLEAPVDPSTYASGFDIPSFQDLGYALQTFAAGTVISFYPFVEGSPFCNPTCSVPADLQMPAIVQDINNLDPGNTDIEHWLDLYNTASTGPGGLPNPYGLTNDPTQQDINYDNLINSSDQSMFDFGNPLPTDPAPTGIETPTNFPVSPAIQDLINFEQASGIQGLVQDWANASGYTPIDWSDPTLLLQPAAATAAVPSNDFDPSQLTSVLGTQLTTDLTQLLASVGSADFSQVLASELAAELPQLLGTQLSTDLLSAF